MRSLTCLGAECQILDINLGMDLEQVVFQNIMLKTGELGHCIPRKKKERKGRYYPFKIKNK